MIHSLRHRIQVGEVQVIHRFRHWRQMIRIDL
jgi:hypothetical protein